MNWKQLSPYELILEHHGITFANLRSRKTNQIEVTFFGKQLGPYDLCLDDAKMITQEWVGEYLIALGTELNSRLCPTLLSHKIIERLRSAKQWGKGYQIEMNRGFAKIYGSTNADTGS